MVRFEAFGRDRNSCFRKLGVDFVGVLVRRTLILLVDIGASDFGKLPSMRLRGEHRGTRLCTRSNQDICTHNMSTGQPELHTPRYRS